MFARIARSWELMKQSWQVLRQDKELMLFPIISTLACLLVMASFVTPIVLSPTVRNALLKGVQAERGPDELANAQQANRNGARENPFVASNKARAQGQGRAGRGMNGGEGRQFQFNSNQIVPALFGFAFYLATTFVIVFFNTALVCCALIRFNGGDPSLGDGIRQAMARLPQIFGWVLLTATVGWILKAVEERAPLVGKFVIGLVGMAWAVVTFMVVPVLAAEKLGPFAAVKRSAGLLRKTWGEALVGQVSLSAVQFLFILPAILGVIAAMVAAISMESMWLFVIAVGVAVVYFVLLAIVFSTLQQIFLAAVYQYAAQGAVPAGFSPSLIESAFQPKPAK